MATTPAARASSTQQTRAEMKKILAEVQSGQFAKEWIDENKTGRKKFLAMREAAPHAADRNGWRANCAK